MKKGTENLLKEMIDENISNLWRELYVRIEEANT